VHHERKRQLLAHLIKSRDLRQVWCHGTKLGCNRLAKELNKLGLHADAIHGDKTQQERIKALDAFKAGTLRVLVATDVAARGIDIEALPFVVNYDLPHNAEDYVHRIGRTGRAGASGEAISLVSESETRYLKDIEKLIGNPIEVVIVPGFEPGAADVPAYQSRSPRATERHGERSARAAGPPLRVMHCSMPPMCRAMRRGPTPRRSRCASLPRSRWRRCSAARSSPTRQGSELGNHPAGIVRRGRLVLVCRHADA